MNERSLKIGKRAFITSFLVLLALMIFSTLLTQILPAGKFLREELNGITTIVSDSYQHITKPSVPLYRILTAPIEVLVSEDATIMAVIIVFLLLMAGSFSLLISSGLISFTMDHLVKKFYNTRYKLLSIVSLVFMVVGAAFGIYEEVIILVPFCILLAKRFNWDSLVGLSMSLLSIGVGFGTAIFNPFTLGVAQQLADLPLFSGFIFRIFIFLSYYIILQLFLQRYAKRIEKNPLCSLTYNEEKHVDNDDSLNYHSNVQKTAKFFIVCLGFIILVLASSILIPTLSSIIFPLIGLCFAIGSFLSVTISGVISIKQALKVFCSGMIGVLPAVLLILMAMSIKLIMTRAMVLDTVLHHAQLFLAGLSALEAIFTLYVLVLIINFFIGSGSAKAFLLLPLLLPLTDLLSINRQIAVQAFVFGDGISNLIYPTNAALMIALGFSVVSYTKWFRFTIVLQITLFIVSLFWLWLAYAIGLGPF